MGYLNRRTPSERPVSIPSRNPFGAGSRRMVGVRRRDQLGDELGILPLVAASVPTVKDLLSKAFTSLVAILDPGKKRDAVREGQAEFWFQAAQNGSVTAARTLHGGTHFPYTVKEKGYYQTRWNTFQAAHPPLAASATAAGDLAPIDAGNSTTPIVIPAATQTTIQNEINAAHGVAASPSPAGSSNALLLLGIAGALWKFLG